MIAMLHGVLAYKSPDHIILDVSGVGYRVQIPFSTYFGLVDEGCEVKLYVHTNVKEDAISLYGFSTMAEKDMFQMLISVSGVGPKMGKDLLSNIAPVELCEAILSKNTKRLSSIPGIGPKTAERLVLELDSKVKKKMGALPAGTKAPAQPEPDTRQLLLDDVASALVNLGYKQALVDKALHGIPVGSDATVESLLKVALKALMK